MFGRSSNNGASSEGNAIEVGHEKAGKDGSCETLEFKLSLWEKRKKLGEFVDRASDICSHDRDKAGERSASDILETGMFGGRGELLTGPIARDLDTNEKGCSEYSLR